MAVSRIEAGVTDGIDETRCHGLHFNEMLNSSFEVVVGLRSQFSIVFEDTSVGRYFGCFAA